MVCEGHARLTSGLRRGTHRVVEEKTGARLEFDLLVLKLQVGSMQAWLHRTERCLGSEV